ncbi:MAG TPA: sigma-70 family RNA polymerase sigma factor [Micromonosporaceae bacterium]|nr:sigma-70 family RNA polymerase sigma factor [Micromonosporaceae bacterium]
MSRGQQQRTHVVITALHEVPVVRMSGRFGAVHTHLVEEAVEKASQQGRPVVVDLARVSLIDAAIARTLRRASAAAGRRGTGFAAAAATGQPLQVLDVLGMTKDLGAHLTLQEAVAEIGAELGGLARPSVDTTVHRLVVEARGLPDGDPRRQRLRDRAIEAALPLARTMALRYQQRGEPLEDLVQVASVGVVRAVHDYDPERGSGFLAYAVPTILGELRRHLRDHLWAVRAPRRLQELRAEIAQNSAELAQDLRRLPSPGDIAERIGADVGDVHKALATATGMRPVSLDAPATDTDRALHELIGSLDPAMDLVDYRLSLRPLIAALPPASQELLKLRFGAELTQSEIATRLGTSQMNVSRMLTAILARFRRALLSVD